MTPFNRSRWYSPTWPNIILTYLAKHKRITRREVAELCRLTLPQAEYLMRKLRKAGKVRLVGKGRNAYYAYVGDEF